MGGIGLRSPIDLEFFMRSFVMEVLTANWDGIWDGANCLLYYDPQESIFIYFREDLDLSLGGSVQWDLIPGFSSTLQTGNQSGLPLTTLEPDNIF